MTPEGIVVAAVEQYFSQPRFRKFSTKKEDRIRFGSRLGFADVVLIDNKGRRAAIVECKQSGIEGYGPAQLKSYLCATDTPFGIFANSTEPDDWEFYENLGRNQFEENVTRPEFENRVVKSENNVITRMSNFFRGISQPGRDEYSKIKSDRKVTGTQPSRKSNPPNPPAGHLKPNIIIQDRPLQNENRENPTIEPSLNGKPYYCEQNGFYWAANHQGIPECLPQHIKRIIHNEEVEIVSTRDEIDEEIGLLRKDVAELDDQRYECDQKIVERTQDLAKKKETLAGLQVQLDSLTQSTPDIPPIQGTPDDITPELDALSIEGIPNNSVIQRLEEEINGFIQEEAHLKQNIYEKSQTLAQKSEKLAELDVQHHVLTQTDPTIIPETLFEEINKFREDKTKLEAQRHECEQEINERTQELTDKKEKLAGLQAQSNLLIETGPETVSDTPATETWIGQWKKWWQTHLGSDTLSIEELPDDSMNDFVDESLDGSGKQYLETEIDNLNHQKDGLEQEIRRKNEELTGAQEEFAELQAQLQAPTETELTSPSEGSTQASINWMHRLAAFFSPRLVALITTIVLVLLAGYLFIFYTSAIDKAFFLNEDAISKQIDEDTTYGSGLRDLVNPNAFKVSQDRSLLFLLFLLLFPSVFLGFALALDYFWEDGKKKWAVLLAFLTLLFDILLGIHISRKIHPAEHEIKKWDSNYVEKIWTLSEPNAILEVSTVIFCGFMVSLLVSILFHVTRKRWEQVKPRQYQFKEELMRETHIEAEKTERVAQIAVVKTRIDNLKNEINLFKGKTLTTEQKISECQTKIEAFLRQRQEIEIKGLRLPIETQIAVLNVEIDNLQNEIEQLTEKMTTTQQNIEDLSKKQRATEIKVARLPIETQIAVLNVEIDNLQNEIEQLTERTTTAQQNIEDLSKKQRETEIRAARLPIETQIAVLNAEINNLQNEINTFKETSTNIQKEVNGMQSKIEEQLRQRNERVVNLSKMQSQVNQFLNGWFRFIAHRTDEETEASDQIERIKQVAADTLSQYHQGSPDYSS